MPPKKANKQETKQKQKVIEDKTFGMKNKNKSTKVQKQIQSMKGSMGLNQNSAAAKQKKKEELEKKKMDDLLLRPTIVQAKVPEGVDPKSIVCEFFKLGQCNKGQKCKFAHDLDIGRKTQKATITTDLRNLSKEEEEETMENWDDDKLRDVVDKKRSTTNKNLKTEIICKYFIQALEENKFGWRWQCKNGDNCIYKHCVPQGFILPSQRRKMELEKEEGPPLEEILESKKAEIEKKTPLTKDIFLQWWSEKKTKKEMESKKEFEERQKNIKSGKILKSGREWFEENVGKYEDDKDELSFDISEFRKQENDGPIYVIEASGTSITAKNIGKNQTGPLIQFKEEEDNNNNNNNNNSNNNEKVDVDETLFNEDEIPDEE